VLDLAREGHTTALDDVIERGVPVNLTGASGDSLLILAAYHDHPATVRMLLDRGADPNRVNDRGQTALGAAVFRRSADAATALLEHGADPDAGGRSAVEIAVFFELEEMSALLARSRAIDVRLLDAADAPLADELAGLVNRVYAVAESGLWREGTTRTTAPEMAEFIAAGEIAVASREGQIAGVVSIFDVADSASEFGMLAAAPEQRGTGVGRALVAFAERHSRERGLRAMQLELLVPRTWRHPSKEFLKGWYDRMGYPRVRITTIAEAHPQLAPLLATPCDLEVREKPLRADGGLAFNRR
jgi:GNAT superfamily N-acetyltransferase